MTVWKTVTRKESGTKSRDYLLGSIFETILTAITDPKDDKALKIKTDPSYGAKTIWKQGTRNTSTSSTFFHNSRI